MGKEIKDIQMVFILGKERSGTSLLQNMLNAHPTIVAPSESKFAVLFYPKFGHIKKWSEQDVLRFADALYTEPLFAHVWHPDKKKLIDELLAVKDNADYGLMCKVAYLQMKNDKINVQLISDKNPHYVLFTDTLLKIFPAAKFIHIVREPRDNIYSHITSFKGKNTIFTAYQWLGFNSIVEENKRKMPQAYFTVIYEDLVNNTESVMRNLCDFLKIEYNPEMKENKPLSSISNEFVKTEMAERAAAINDQLTKPLTSDNIGKWKNGMSAYNRKVTEIVTADFARKLYNYDVEIDATNKVSVPAIKLLYGRYLYHTWAAFTRFRFKYLAINRTYLKFKKAVKGDKLPYWEYY